MKNISLFAIGLIIAAAALGFFGGMKYQESKSPNIGRQFANNQGGFNGRLGGNGNRPVVVEIISADNNSITVKLADGSSKIVLLSGKTSVSHMTEASRLI